MGARTQVPPEDQGAMVDSSAVSGRERLLAQPQSPEAYQAEGNAWVQKRDYGRAILAYERGLRLAPGHAALTNNLRFARREADVAVPRVREFFLAKWWRGLGAWLGVATAQYLALAFWWLAVLGAAFWYLRRRKLSENRRFALLPVAFVCLLLAIICYQLAASRLAFLQDDSAAILLQDQIDLRVAPDAASTLKMTLSAGRKMTILDEFDAFTKVLLDDGEQGWLPTASIERI